MNKILNSIPLLLAIALIIIGVNRKNDVNSVSVNIDSKNESVNIDNELLRVIPKSIYDGDTLWVIRNGEEVKIRFACIDAPELKQELGIKSRDYLRSLLKANNYLVKVNTVNIDRYGREVAELFLSDGTLVQELQARDGMVFGYEKYSDDCPNWEKVRKAELTAIDNNLGVQINKDYPWDFR